ncbi:serine/threonine-protein kinase [Rhodopirellula maiorica SM1]|uniref:Serine/threonine-protein kinase n=1 Tax=Rhodopirellula maiorica SM1 TaxID=1265738 RepID=M5RMY6_9BACT|nr:hypothetical protein [Rhodopirellula maiorica]EMI15319.1 serine/threonine-protein kinase [Rhodopirellula maiorica SM1]
MLSNFLTIFSSILLTCSVIADDATAEQSKVVFRVAQNEPAPDVVEYKLPNDDGSIYVNETNIADASDIERVSFFRDRHGRLAVSLVFTEDGAQRMESATSTNIIPKNSTSGLVASPGPTHKRIAVILNGRVLAAPNILVKVGKNVDIVGKFTDEDITNLFSAFVLGYTPVASR